MREIKFRAYDIALKKMHYSAEPSLALPADGERRIYSINFYTESISLIYEECNDEGHSTGKHHVYDVCNGFIKLMQFTGLHDKNGTEIYESDIVKYDNELHVVNLIGDDTYKVFDHYLIGASFCDGSLDEICKNSVEVIGNIHENKDLLNERETD